LYLIHIIHTSDRIWLLDALDILYLLTY